MTAAYCFGFAVAKRSRPEGLVRGLRSALVDIRTGLHAPGSALDRFWRFATILLTLALVAHAAFLILFLALGLWFLSAVNVVSVAVYVTARSRAQQQRYSAILLMVVEFFGHAVAASWTLGWASGFQYYLLLGIPIHIMSERRARQRLVMPIAITAGFLGLSAAFEGATPHAQVDPTFLIALRMGNLTAFCAFLIYICLTYVALVRHAERRLRVLAEVDPLTGLYNRASVVRFAEGLAGVAPGRGTWLIFADLDHFKSVNDRFGHLRGDDTIRFAADEIRRTIRRGDHAARWGGEEFLVLLPDADRRTALGVAERIRSSIAERSAATLTDSCSVSVTVGVAEFHRGEDLDVALSRADAALYLGKANGRDRVELSG